MLGGAADCLRPARDRWQALEQALADFAVAALASNRISTRRDGQHVALDGNRASPPAVELDGRARR